MFDLPSNLTMIMFLDPGENKKCTGLITEHRRSTLESRRKVLSECRDGEEVCMLGKSRESPQRSVEKLAQEEVTTKGKKR